MFVLFWSYFVNFIIGNSSHSYLFWLLSESVEMGAALAWNDFSCFDLLLLVMGFNCYRIYWV